MNYNSRKWEEARIDIKKEILFDSTVLSLTANSLDYYLRRCLSRPHRNNVRFTVQADRRATSSRKLSVFLIGTSLTRCGKPNSRLSWTIGATGPGEQFFQADPDEIATLLDRLCYILQRMEPIDFSTWKDSSRFLLYIFNRLIRHANSAFKLKAALSNNLITCLYIDPYTKLMDGSFSIRLYLHGFDFQLTGLNCYRAKYEILVSKVSLKPLSVLYGDRYMDVRLDCGERTEDPDSGSNVPLRSGTTRSLEFQRRLHNVNHSDQKAQFEKAQQLAQTISRMMEGFLGPKVHLQSLATGTKRAHYIDESRIRSSLGVMWRLGKREGGSILKPSSYVSLLLPQFATTDSPLV